MRAWASRVGVILMAVAAVSVAAQDSDEQEIRATIQHYFDGLLTGKGEHYRIAFHPEARLLSVGGDGRLATTTSLEYAERAAPPSPDESAGAELRIARIDRAGTAAMARVELDLAMLVFVDYMSLLKVDGRWQIVNKTSAAIPKRR